MNVLFLTIKKEHFDKIVSGEKKEEYREIKPHWDKRLSRAYDAVIFQNGYSPNSPRITLEWKGIEKKDRYVIKLGNILS